MNELEALVDAMDEASPETLRSLFFLGVAATADDRAWPIGSCGMGIRAMAQASAETKQTLVAASFEECPYMCPSGDARDAVFGAIAQSHPMDKAPLLIAACDATEEETVFSGRWMDQREQMSIFEYWVARASFEIVRVRLSAIDSDRSKSLWRRFEGHIDEMAGQMVLFTPPRRDDLTLPRSSSSELPRPGTTVAVSTTDISVDGEILMSFDLTNAEVSGGLIEPLSAHLRETAQAHPQAGSSPEGGMQILVQAHAQAPAGLIRGVLFTADQAGYTELQLAVFHETLGRQMVVEASYWDPQGRDVRRMWDDRSSPLVVWVTDEGFTVRPPGLAGRVLPQTDGTFLIPRRAATYDPAGLLEAVLGLDVGSSPMNTVVVIPEEGVDWQTVIQVADGVRHDRRLAPLFSRVALATAADASELAPAEQPPPPDPPPPAARVSFGGPMILGSLSRSEVDRVVALKSGAIAGCLDRGRRSFPELQGKVVVKFTIGSDGDVSSAALKSATLDDREVQECVVRRFRRMTFPKPTAGGIVIVSYPVTLQ